MPVSGWRLPPGVGLRGGGGVNGSNNGCGPPPPPSFSAHGNNANSQASTTHQSNSSSIALSGIGGRGTARLSSVVGLSSATSHSNNVNGITNNSKPLTTAPSISSVGGSAANKFMMILNSLHKVSHYPEINFKVMKGNQQFLLYQQWQAPSQPAASHGTRL